MFSFYVIALLATPALVYGDKEYQLHLEPLDDPASLVGNWDDIYHWDKDRKRNQEYKRESVMTCPEIEIKPATEDYIKKIEDKCGRAFPFDSDDTKLMFNAPVMGIKDSIIFFGKYGTIMLKGCIDVPVEVRRVNVDVIVLTNKDSGDSELLSKLAMRGTQANWMARNIDVGKDMYRIGFCTEPIEYIEH